MLKLLTLLVMVGLACSQIDKCSELGKSQTISIPKTGKTYERGDQELYDLLCIQDENAENAILVNHTRYFQNSSGSLGRIYALGVDPYTVDDTPKDLSYKIYSAVGYGISNINLLIRSPKEGFVIIDSGSGVSEVDTIIAAFQEKGFLPAGKKVPLRAIIYTHNHVDHTGGGARWIKHAKLDRCPARNDGKDGIYFAQKNCVEIIAHRKLTDGVINTATRSGQYLDPRSIYTHGALAIKGTINYGIGPSLSSSGTTYEPPSKTFSEFLDFRVAGMQLRVESAPSETEDEIIVFVPDKTNRMDSPPNNPEEKSGVLQKSIREDPQNMGAGALFSAEALQGPPALPNLYSLRGTMFRSPLVWYETVDKIRLFDSWCMVGTHGVPIMKRENVQTFLTNFRDAVQYIHDQTLRYIRQGYIPDELVTLVDKIPDNLISSLDSIANGLPTTKETPGVDPRNHLRSLYGTVPQAVRAIYFGYVGWNQGDPTYFKPLPPTKRANKYVQLFGGACAVLKDAQSAYDESVAKIGTDVNWKDGLRWTAEVLSYVLSASDVCLAHVQAARALKSKALLRLASSHELYDVKVLEEDLWSLSAPWRNWLIVGGQELVMHMSNSQYPHVTALSSTQNQQGVPPRYWVQHWCWRFNTETGDALNNKRFGWKFLADGLYWQKNSKYVLEVKGKVVRLVTDKKSVDAIWKDVDLAVEVSYKSFVELVNKDKNGVNFGKKLKKMINSSKIKLLKGSANDVGKFYDSRYFDAVPTDMPNMVERPVPTEPLRDTDCECVGDPGVADAKENVKTKEYGPNGICGSLCVAMVGVGLSLVLVGCITCAVYCSRRKNRGYDVIH